jgi:hypothetical protein
MPQCDPSPWSFYHPDRRVQLTGRIRELSALCFAPPNGRSLSLPKKPSRNIRPGSRSDPAGDGRSAGRLGSGDGRYELLLADPATGYLFPSIRPSASAAAPTTSRK